MLKVRLLNLELKAGKMKLGKNLSALPDMAELKILELK